MIKEKLFVFLLLLGFSSNLALSQDVEVFNGGQFFVDRTEYVESVLEVDDDESSVLTRTGLIGNKFRVLNLDQNLMEKSKFEIEIPEVGGKKLKYFWSVKLGESIYFMSRYFDSKANDYYLYASELNVKTGAFVRHLEAVKVNRKEFKNLVNPFRAVRSVDSTKVLFITEYPTGANEDVQYGFKVVNSDMSEVWSKDVIFPIKDKAFSILDYDVDKDGNIHFTAAIRMTLDEKNDKNSKGRYYVNIYSYFHETGELVQYEVGFQNEVIRNMDLELTAENELVGIGFYSERSMVESYKGMFYLRIDPKTKEVKNKSLTPFGTELLSALIGERKADKGKEMPPYEIRATINLENGGTAVVAEHYVHSVYTTTNAQGQTQTVETWLYGNVLVMYLDPQGKMLTASVLKKAQICSTSGSNFSLMQLLGLPTMPTQRELPYYGIAIMENKGNVYILYNENPKNAERLKSGKKPVSVRQRDSETQLVTFTPDGNISSSVLFKSKDKEAGYKMPLMPRESVQFSKNSMIVFGTKGKYMRAAKVTIK